MTIRRATPADVASLGAIAFAAKAHWGYSPEQLEAWRSDLEVRADSLDSRPIYLAEDEAGPVGFVQVATDTSPWEIWALWVHPRRMRQGIGRVLLAEACRLARDAGEAELFIDADPNAEGFYRSRGARVVAHVRAPIAGQPMRSRPQLLLPLGVA